MNWRTFPYRLAPEVKAGMCQRLTNSQQPCSNRATCGFTSILIGQGDRRYIEQCDACALATAKRMGIESLGFIDAVVFPIPVSAESTRCQDCNAAVRWIYNHAGRLMAVEPNGIAHALTCPGGCAHRKRA